MKISKNIYLVAMMVLSQLVAPMSFAADTSIATMNLSGDVPTVFSVTARGYPGDLDLSPNVVVNDRLLGTFHLKYNVNIASLTLKTDTASGVPEKTGAVAYSFGTTFKVKFSACSSVIAANQALFSPTQAGIDVKSATAAALTTSGVEEDCDLSASWGGTAVTLPLAGKYSMTFTLTMISI